MSVSCHRFRRRQILPSRTTLRRQYGAGGWPASTAMQNTCVLSQRTSLACPFSAPVDQTVSPQLSNLGSSRTLTAVLANWRLATPAYSGWWHCGPIAMPSPVFSTLRWSGVSRPCRHWRSHTWWMPRMPGCCGTAWGILSSVQRMQEGRWRRTTLISRKCWGSSRRWKATFTDTSGWIYQREVWARSPRRWDQPNLMAG